MKNYFTIFNAPLRGRRTKPQSPVLHARARIFVRHFWAFAALQIEKGISSIISIICQSIPPLPAINISRSCTYTTNSTQPAFGLSHDCLLV